MKKPQFITFVEALRMRTRAVSGAISTFERLAEERLEQKERGASVRDRETAERIRMGFDTLMR